MINKQIIREYDIRGIYESTLTPVDAYLVGKSFAIYVKKYKFNKYNKISVARDGRLSSPILSQKLIEGILSEDMEVVDLGIGPTPMLYYSNYILDVDAGIMVTGSHNPKDYNGFKFILNQGAFFGTQIKELYDISTDITPEINATHTKKITHNTVCKNQYIEMLASTFAGKKELKIAWDAGNGATGEVLAELTKRLPGTHILLNEKIDGTFPAHHPDPTVLKNLEQLIDVVKTQKCDLGIAFDGDGDRLGVVDRYGRAVVGDTLLIILAKEILAKNPGAPIIADIKTTLLFEQEIRKMGGVPVVYKTGHSNIKSHMKKINAPLAGEVSGHIFIADNYYGYDDALYAGVRLINYLSSNDINLETITDALPKIYSTPEIRVSCREEQKFEIIKTLQASLRADGVNFNDIDGIRCNFEDAWWLIRASNTENILVLRFEAKDKQKLYEHFEIVQSMLKAFDLKIDEDYLEQIA